MAEFGCIQPGFPPCSNFQQVSAEKWLLNLGQLQGDQLAVFLTGSHPLPQGSGIGVYVSRSHVESFEYIGRLGDDCPSGIFTIPVTFMEIAGGAPLTLGLLLLPITELQNLEAVGIKGKQVHDKGMTYIALARKLAADFSEYMGSFLKVDASSQQEYLLRPSETLQNWLAKVVKRLERDPDWWSKN